MNIIDRIRKEKVLYSCWSVLRKEPTRRKFICPLPFHVHKSYTASFAILQTPDNGERWRCFGSCNLEGDVVDLVGYLKIPGYDPHDIKMVERAWSMLDGNFAIQEIPPLPKKARLAQEAWKHPLGAEVIAYAKTRGLREDTLVRFKVGQVEKNGRMCMSMPVFEDGQLVAVKYRCITQKRFFAEKGSRIGMLNYDRINLTDEPVLILKGEIPVYLCDQLGFVCCAITGGESYAGREYLPNLAFSRRRVVVGDNDAAGIAGARKRAEALSGIVKFPDPRFKDIDLWILSDPGAVGVIRSWLYD